MNTRNLLLDSDPAIRWQVLRDLVRAPVEVVAKERSRVALERWGLGCWPWQRADDTWAGGACFPEIYFNVPDESSGQPWTSILPTLQLLHGFGVDPDSERIRGAIQLVKDHCRWEHAGQPFFSAEVEPCINGRTVTLGWQDDVMRALDYFRTVGDKPDTRIHVLTKPSLCSGRSGSRMEAGY